MRSRLYLVLVLFVSALPLLAMLLTPLLPHTHDGFVHLARIAAYYKALSDGQFPVRWAGDLNYGYGLPLFNFMYQIPYIISSVFVFFGLGLVSAFKLALVLSYLLSGVFSYLFGKEFFKDNKKAFLFTVFYQFFPFRFIELLVRGSFGEVYTYAFLPLVLYSLLRLIKKRKPLDFVLTSFATALLVLSHNSVSLLFFTVIAGFVVFYTQDKKNILVCFLALLTGLLLSAFYWIPALLEHKYTYGDLLMKDLYKEHFVPFSNFFIPNLANDKSLQTGGISVWIGLIQELSIVAVAIAFLKDKKRSWEKLSLFCILLLCVSFFFMEPVSKIFWEKIPLLRQFQFPWRFLAVVGFATSLLSTMYFSATKNNRWYAVILVIAIISSAGYWKASLGYDKIKESDYWNFPLNTTYYGETDIIWSAGPAKKYPESRIQFVQGEGQITNLVKKSSTHTFTVKTEKDAVLADNTQYFPGWRVYVDGKQAPVEFQDQNWRGLITFPITKGTHSVLVKFEESRVRLIADLLSIGCLVIMVGYYFVYKNSHEA